MTADVKLLKLPDSLKMPLVLDESIYDYARANVAHHTAAQAAENKRLRVEVRNLRDDAHRRSSEIAALGDAVQHWMKRAERLAEAGRRVTAAFSALGDSSCITAAAIKRRECEAAMLAFDALLRDQEGPTRETASA